MHTVHGLIRKSPFIKQLQDSTMFAFELSEMVKDYKTGEKVYSNYRVMLFAKSPAAVQFYTDATSEGSFVVVSSKKLKVEQREHEGKIYVSLVMDGALLEGANIPEANKGVQQGGYNQGGQQQPMQQPAQQPAKPAQQAPQSQPAPQVPDLDDGWDDDIPF